jgi:hypothetical protein
MMRCRPPAWLLFLSVGGLVAATAGCGRRVVAPAPDVAAAADPDLSPEKAAGDGPPFHFPNDAGGALLAKVLPPADVNGPLKESAAGPRRPSPAGLTVPPLPLPPSQAAPPAAPAERNRKPLEPRLVVEETLGLVPGDPEPPQPRSFFVGDRIRLSSVNVNQPVPLPILALPTADRAPLDDPTVDASAAAALAAAMPQRTNPIAYFRLTLPDPFANRQSLLLPVPPDDGIPRTGTVHPPKP